MKARFQKFFHNHFTAIESPIQWSGFRVAFFSCLLYRMWEQYSWRLHVLATSEMKNPIPLFEDLGITRIYPDFYNFVYLGLFVLFALAVLGIGLRVVLPLILLGCLYIFGNDLGLERPAYSNYVYHSRNLVIYVLFIFVLAAFANASRFKWPVTAVKLTIAAFYFGSAYTKLVDTGFQWINGYTLQGILYTSHILNPRPQTLWLANQHELCTWLSIATILLDLSFIFVCLTRRVVFIWIFGLIGFHLAVDYFLNIVFYKFHLYAYLIFINWAWVTEKLKTLIQINRKTIQKLLPGP